MSDLIGQSLGRYHILEQLGEGGMATVYKAYDTRLETDVAVKVIRTENILPSSLERTLKRFEREAKALARLTHPNIVKVTDYGEYEGKPYLVMEYLPSGTLKGQLRGKPMPWQNAARLLLPIARALGFAHRQGLIHRDVKPSNILITADGEPMLTDFGIAKILDLEETMDLTGTSAAIGTPEYMAPEQASSKSIDQRADIYALGVVFYEMVTGRKPYTADTPMAVIIKQASEPLPRPRQFIHDLPQAVENVLLKALAKKPEDRYATMGEFAVALEKLAAQTVTIQTSPPVAAVKRGGLPVWIYLLGGIVLLAFLAGGYMMAGKMTVPAPTAMATVNPSTTPTATVLISTVVETHLNPTQKTNINFLDVISKSQVIFSEAFDQKISSDWNPNPYSELVYKNGVLHIDGNSSWPGLERKTGIEDKQASFMLVRSDNPSNFVVKVQYGPWGQSIYKNWGLLLSDSFYDLNMQGSSEMGGNPLEGNLDSINPDHWYYVLLWNRGGGKFYIRVWDKADPSHYCYYSLDRGADWAGLSWTFVINGDSGFLEVDNYKEIQLTNIPGFDLP